MSAIVDERVTIEMQGAELYVSTEDGVGQFLDPAVLDEEVPTISEIRENAFRLLLMRANAIGKLPTEMHNKRIVVDLDDADGNVVKVLD